MSRIYDAKIEVFDDKIIVTKYGNYKVKPRKTEFGSPKLDNEEKETKEQREKRRSRQAFRMKRKIKNYILANDFDLFWTLTLDDTKVNAYDFQLARKELQKWLKYLREKYGRFDYLFLPEAHKSGRFHFHGVTGQMFPILTEARSAKTGRLLKKKGLQIYNAENWSNGFNTVSKIASKDKASNYITKYITKDFMQIPRLYKQPSYLVSRGLKSPNILYEILNETKLDEFVPSFVVGEVDADSNKFKPNISIFYLNLDKNGNPCQEKGIETFLKLKQEKSPDGNQDSL